MRITQKIHMTFWVALLLAMTGNAHAMMVPIDMNSFHAEGPAVVNSAGNIGAMFNDGYLLSDPNSVDSAIAVPENLLALSFDYLFLNAPGSAWTFTAFLLGNTNDDILAQFWADDTSWGHVSWDLSGLDAAVTSLGLNFAVYPGGEGNSGGAALALVGNPRLEVADASQVPEPAIMLLLGSSLLGLAVMGRRRIHR